MHALRNIQAALLPNGLLVDTQPISAHPRVIANGAELGALDMREWIETMPTPAFAPPCDLGATSVRSVRGRVRLRIPRR